MQALVPVLAAAASFGLIVMMLNAPRLRLPVDHPNERSLHSHPILRTGGIGILCGIGLSTLLLRWSPLTIACTAGVALLSYRDDRAGLPTLVRFIVHGLVAAIFLAAFQPELEIYWLVLLWVAIVWMTNLYNFMDGSDGLAGGMTVIGFGTYAVAACWAGDLSLASVAMSVSAATAAFLVFNFAPARIFMGDVGSVPLGFLAAVMGLQGWRESLWPLWFPLLVFAPFVLDASTTLARRALRGEPFWRAHRCHYYQRLIQLGWSHRRTALVEYLLMLACSALALWAMGQPRMIQIVTLSSTLAAFSVLACAVDWMWRQHQSGHTAESRS